MPRLSPQDEYRLAEEAKALRNLKESPGWKLLEQIVEEREQVIKDQLLRVDPADTGKIALLQARAKEVRHLFHMIDERIRRGDEALERLVGKDGDTDGGHR